MLIVYEEQPPKFPSAKNTPISEYGKMLLEKDRQKRKELARHKSDM